MNTTVSIPIGCCRRIQSVSEQQQQQYNINNHFSDTINIVPNKRSSNIPRLRLQNFKYVLLRYIVNDKNKQHHYWYLCRMISSSQKLKQQEQQKTNITYLDNEQHHQKQTNNNLSFFLQCSTCIRIYDTNSNSNNIVSNILRIIQQSTIYFGERTENSSTTTKTTYTTTESMYVTIHRSYGINVDSNTISMVQTIIDLQNEILFIPLNCYHRQQQPQQPLEIHVPMSITMEYSYSNTSSKTYKQNENSDNIDKDKKNNSTMKNKDGKGGQQQQTLEPLLALCLKRQFTAVPILRFASTSTLVSTTIQFTFQDNSYTFHVQSCTLLPTTTTSSTSDPFVLIIHPSTYITLLPVSDCSNNNVDSTEYNPSHVSRTLKEKQELQHQEKSELYEPVMDTKRDISKTGTTGSIDPVQRLLETMYCIEYNCTTNNSNVKSIDIPRGFLFTGPPGVGKTHAVRTAIQRMQQKNDSSVMTVKLISYQGSMLLANGNGDSDSAQKFLNDIDDIIINSTNTTITILFLDEIDALMKSISIVSILTLILDRMNTIVKWSNLIIIGATNHINTIPIQLRRPGRFDREIILSPPSSTARYNILKSLCTKVLFHNNNKSNSTHMNNTTSNNSICINQYPIQNEQQCSENVNTATDQKEEDTLQSSSNYFNIDTNFEKQLIQIAQECVGYVPSDLTALVRTTELLYTKSLYRRICNDIQTHDNKNSNNSSDDEHFNPEAFIPFLRQAMNHVGASVLRNTTVSTRPKIGWDDIVGNPGNAKTILQQSIEWPRKYDTAFVALDIQAPRGILLYGPPGCAKTTLARAAAGALGISFISYEPADVYSTSYVGDAEATIRNAFIQARAASPCILFFDEIDSIIGTTGSSSSSSNDNDNTGLSRGNTSSTEARVLSTFLNEMDGIDSGGSSSSSSTNHKVENDVLVLGATNRPWALDAALLRPGRFDKIIYVPAPDSIGRRAILHNQCTKWKQLQIQQQQQHGNDDDKTKDDDDDDNCIDVDLLASDEYTKNMTGAEIIGACHTAALNALKSVMEHTKNNDCNSQQEQQEQQKRIVIVRQEHLIEALQNVHPLLSNPIVLNEYVTFEKKNERSA